MGGLDDIRLNVIQLTDVLTSVHSTSRHASKYYIRVEVGGSDKGSNLQRRSLEKDLKNYQLGVLSNCL